MRHSAAAVGLVALLCHVAAAAAPGDCDSRGPVSLFVASSGSSSPPTTEEGTIARPFRSLPRARDEVRALRRGPCGLPSGGVTIHLREGVHFLRSPLHLGAADSGTARAPITWRAHAGEPVLISGGVEVPRAAFSAVPARPHLLQVNLTHTLGLTDFGAIKVGGADGPPVDTDMAELFFGGQPMHLARWPNQYANGSTQWAYTGPGTPTGCTTACTGFELRNNASVGPLAPSQSRLLAWAKEAHERAPYLHGYWQFDWRDTYTPLGVGATGHIGTLKVADPSLLAKAELGARFYALNLLSELDAAGEYFLERTNGSAPARAGHGMLYFYPPAGDWADLDQKIYLSMAPSLVVLGEGAAHVSFVGLRFEHSRGTAIASGGSGHVHHITIQNCTVANTGGGGNSRRGGAIDLTGTSNLIDSCTVYGTAGTGVSLRGGFHVNLTRGENLMRNCEVHTTSRWFRTYRPGIAWAGVGNTFQGNHIYDLPHAAFLGGGNEAVCTADWPTRPAWWPADRGVCGANDNVFRDNLVEDVGHECSDTGAFYTCGQIGTGRINLNNSLINNTFRRIRNRGVLHWRGVPSLGVGSPFVQAVYLDDGMSGWWASDNTFHDVQNAFLLNGGTQNVAIRNSFKQVDNCVWLSVEYSDQVTYDNLVRAATLPAWQKYKNFGGAVPRHTTNWGLSSYANYSAFHHASVTSKDNLFQNNSFCETCASGPDPRGAFCQCCVGSDSSSFRNNTNTSARACSR